jgi:hypothetical protein
MYSIRYSGHILNEVEFSQKIFYKPSDIKFRASPSSKNRAKRQTDTMKLTVALRNAAKQNEDEPLTVAFELRCFWRSETNSGC